VSTGPKKKPSLEELLTRAGQNGIEKVAGLERELWRRNARFRAWAGILPLQARWERGAAGYLLSLGCRACEREYRWERQEMNFLVKGAERIFDVAERKALNVLRARGCEHLEPLAGPDPEEVQLIMELELLVG
jgi:hypothetical protein